VLGCDLAGTIGAVKTVELWSAYVAWLRDNAPLAHANLAPPASDAQIAEVERVLGVTLPEAAKLVWRCNDGQRETMIASSRAPAVPCIPTLSFLSTAKVVEVWRVWDELRAGESPAGLADLQSAGRSVFPGKVRPLYTHPAWVPWWSDPTRADYIGLDLDPDEQGTRGQVINFGRDEESHAVFADDLDGLLAILLDEVRSGAWQASRMPYGKDDTIDWFGDPDAHFFNALQSRRPKTDLEIAQERFTEAKRLRAAKQPERALELVAQAWAAYPGFGPALLQLEVDALEDLERWQDADDALARLVARAPKLPQHALRRGRNLLDRLADVALAEAVVREALAVAPTHAELLALLDRVLAAKSG